ncbi:DNA polymerase III subunit epsilon [Mesotoga sp. HF07.pep.5.2.highcov]|jgi:DNA polymerase-3 subunit epsilon|uniref:Exonuclease, DNA polymerase III, epsilon subunit family n=1 Tax=Mesotoga prima MesG1.Ag.4.2 TaxID=660470 RepID=I2F3I8_9BACT|nr:MULTISPECIES: 3'-5' exonuclease [Mesotoga]MDK2944799.1 polymerase subunit epsilon [Mesotoga sp.]AFK06491.1 exonuclease, DNA polymerase III, epsilon subunit family [Mesotoga prima MesG1.Ag.4.2]PIJ62290.1 DNA polymerase III subunit epsilon [Mesotoga sp. H07.pep.5.3]RLL87849.1 DNA polymerase III subunit epsilon [Mesotoga sp. H07pep.5.4]RLL91269.1 DNA polymerase III subunit epsilon [Mesotoga sp. HF07.pep.5.2.highcov]
MKKIYLVIDTETTGSSPLEGDRILEIAAIPVYGNKILHNLSFQSLVNPLVMIPAQITGIHGLKNEDVLDEPTMAEVFPRFRNYVGGATIVGHNIVNDMTFFDIASKETGILPLANNYIDTIDIAHEVFSEGPYGLKSIAKRLRIRDVPTHRAMDDARVTAKVFLALARRLGGISQMVKYEKKWRG